MLCILSTSSSDPKGLPSTSRAVLIVARSAAIPPGSHFILGAPGIPGLALYQVRTKCELVYFFDNP